MLLAHLRADPAIGHLSRAAEHVRRGCIHVRRRDAAALPRLYRLSCKTIVATRLCRQRVDNALHRGKMGSRQDIIT